MTLLPPTLAQSTLAEKGSIYLNSVSDNLPTSLHSLHDQFAAVLTSTLTSKTSLQIRTFTRQFISSNQELLTTYPATLPLLLTAVLCVVLSIAIMSSWRNPLGNFFKGSRTPQVSERDFSYVNPDEVDDQQDSDKQPDILLLKHRGVTHPLHFQAYAIDDGKLTVGKLRQHAAQATGSSDADRVKLLYKGKLLKDNSKPCKMEGLKQQSEVLCVVSEVSAASSENSNSNDEAEDINTTFIRQNEPNNPRDSETTLSSNNSDNTTSATATNSKSKRRRNNKKNKPKRPAEDQSTKPVNTTGSTSTSALPPPAPNLNSIPSPLDKVNALRAYFQTELFPLYQRFVSNPPADTKARDTEYRKVNVSIVDQVFLKADGIESEGNSDVRDARRALIKEAQACLTELDRISKS